MYIFYIIIYGYIIIYKGISIINIINRLDAKDAIDYKINKSEFIFKCEKETKTKIYKIQYLNLLKK